MSVFDNLGLDVNKFTKKNPASAELDEQSKQLEGLTTDNIKKIRGPRNQARHIDNTINRVGDRTCENISAKVQALLKGEITPKQFAEALAGVGSGAVDSLMKDGLGVNDISALGKKSLAIGAALLADRAGLDDQLQNMLNKIRSNKRKVRDISDVKKQEDRATKDIFKKLPPVLRNILKGDPNALKSFIDKHCTEARRNMANNALGRAGLSGKVRNFVDNK